MDWRGVEPLDAPSHQRAQGLAGKADAVLSWRERCNHLVAAGRVQASGRQHIAQSDEAVTQCDLAPRRQLTRGALRQLQKERFDKHGYFRKSLASAMI
jgi:hypothetical protein